jgi:hypothetical protein
MHTIETIMKERVAIKYKYPVKEDSIATISSSSN